MFDENLELMVFAGRMQYIYGMGLASPGSTNTPHPDTAGVASLGASVGGMIVAEYRLCPSHEFAGHLWNYENQHGSLIGQADFNGDRTVEYDYTDYGLTMERPILIDGRTGNISGIAHDGFLNITSVTFTNGLPSATVLGAEVRVARPGAASDRLLFATVAGTAGGTTIVFPDAGAAIYNAINSTGYGLTVLPFYDNFWGGVWSGASYSSGTGLTTFTGNFGTPVGGGALGDSVKPGMVVIPDLLKAVPLHIESVSINLLGSDTLTVKGDATGLGGNGTRFRIHQHAPYKYDLTDEVKRNNPCELGARYLWSSYRRIPWTWSRAGEDPYLAWNRVYLPEIGRWTSADALATPWTNSNGYVRHSAQARDTSGLDGGPESAGKAEEETLEDQGHSDIKTGHWIWKRKMEGAAYRIKLSGHPYLQSTGGKTTICTTLQVWGEMKFHGEFNRINVVHDINKKPRVTIKKLTMWEVDLFDNDIIAQESKDRTIQLTFVADNVNQYKDPSGKANNLVTRKELWETAICLEYDKDKQACAGTDIMFEVEFDLLLPRKMGGQDIRETRFHHKYEEEDIEKMNGWKK